MPFIGLSFMLFNIFIYYRHFKKVVKKKEKIQILYKALKIEEILEGIK